ncbi:exonuclease, DNA polymerase III, epsilon subunit family [Massilia yuzhufengensis]|uniref:DNA-directed DNA polymerase n=2 Tax=Massilia yuzhufengensis TaxID=1164594 RepID=A0A1I1SYX3_9BURK|nr:exonuclease, DNA polymerase III, epsilon subunit family [Massilia yuzhufengensis]
MMPTAMQNPHYPTSGDPIVFFDVETSGLCARKDSIIELAAVKFIPGADTHPHIQHLIATERPLSPFITKLTGINDDMLMTQGRPMQDVLDEFIDFIEDHPLVAFNINADARFLNAVVERHGRPPLRNIGHCALARARLAWPELGSHKLVKLAKHLELEVGTAHRALDHTRLALEVYFRALQVEGVREPARAADRSIAAGAPSIIPVITGPRQFRIEVLGTRRYQDIFEAVCGPRTGKGAALDIPVQLRIETGSNAVKVMLQEEVVGNLAPRVAIDFRRALVERDLAGFRHFECAATIRGGRISKVPAEGDYVMWLDLPQDDDEGPR